MDERMVVNLELCAFLGGVAQLGSALRGSQSCAVRVGKPEPRETRVQFTPMQHKTLFPV